MAKDNKKKVIFLDRDGTINVDFGYTYKVEDWKFIGKVVDALKMLQEQGFSLSVVTNQSGIGHGLYSEEDMEKLHKHMLAEFKKNNINIEYVAYCPHGRESTCKCRKPNIGMIEEIAGQIGPVDLSNSWTIGDKLLDFELGLNASTKTALIRSQYWTKDDLAKLPNKPDLIIESLYEAAQAINKIGSK